MASFMILLIAISSVEMGRSDAVELMQLDQLVIQLRDGELEMRLNAQQALLKNIERPLPNVIQNKLFEIFSNRNLPKDVRTDAIQILLETTTALTKFEVGFQKIAESHRESAEVRVGAILGLQIILRGRAETAKSADLLLTILNNQNDLTSVRILAGNALCESAPSCLRVFPILMKLIASQDESFEVRVQMMRLIPLITLSMQKDDVVANLLIRMAADTSESVHLRREAMTSLALNLIHSDFDSIEMSISAKRVSRELSKILAEPKNDHGIRVGAGIALQACSTTDVDLVAELTNILKSDERFLHEYAAYGLRNIGPNAVKAVPRLIEVWRDATETKESREAAMEALIQIDPLTAENLGISPNRQ